MRSCWEREEVGGFTCAGHPAVGPGQWYTTAVELPFSPSLCLWLPISLFIKPPPTFCAMNLILFNGCPGLASFARRIRRGSTCNSSFSQYQVSNKEQVGGRFLRSISYPVLLPWYPCCVESLGLWVGKAFLM